MRVEVFIKNEEVPVRKVLVKGVCPHGCADVETFMTERIMDDVSRRVLDEARKKAEDLKARIVVYNLSTLKGKLLARLKGVKSPSWKVIE